MSETMIVSATLATIASVLFGVQVHLQNAGFDHVDAPAGALINVGATTAFMWALAPFFFQPENLVLRSLVLFALAGLLAPAISLSLMTRSVQLIGPSLSSGLGSARVSSWGRRLGWSYWSSPNLHRHRRRHH